MGMVGKEKLLYIQIIMEVGIYLVVTGKSVGRSVGRFVVVCTRARAACCVLRPAFLCFVYRNVLEARSFLTSLSRSFHRKACVYMCMYLGGIPPYIVRGTRYEVQVHST